MIDKPEENTPNEDPVKDRSDRRRFSIQTARVAAFGAGLAGALVVIVFGLAVHLAYMSMISMNSTARPAFILALTVATLGLYVFFLRDIVAQAPQYIERRRSGIVAGAVMMTILLCLEVLVLWGTTKLTACAGAVPLDMVGWCNAPAISRTFTLQLMTTAASLVMLLGAFALAYYKRQATILGAAVTVCSLTLMLLWTVPVWFLN